VGVTNNLDRRVFEHKQKLIEGFTRKYDCDRLVWHEQWTFAQHAIHREKQLKGWTRARKIALIEEMNPRWTDLADGWGQAKPGANGGSDQKA
jgi:putative endonuclease